MKMHTLIASVALAAAGTVHAAGEKHDHAHEHKPMHGGVVVEVKDMDYELVAKADAEAAKKKLEDAGAKAELK